MNNDINQKEELEEKLFNKHYDLQTRTASKIIGIIFGIIGAIFLIMGIILLAFGVRDEEGFLVGIVFTPMGCFWLILSIVLYFAIRKSKFSYKKYKERVTKYGLAYNSYDLIVTVSIQSEKIETLEQKISILEKRIKEFENNEIQNDNI